MTQSTFWQVALRPDVMRRAMRVGLIVGTVLALINHADAVLDASFNGKNLIQVILSYLVPYSVSTYSSVGAILEQDHHE